VKVTPDNFLAQKLLSQIYLEEGDVSSAEKSLRVLVLLQPDEVEGKLMLEALEKATEKKKESEQMIVQDTETIREDAVSGTYCNDNVIFSEDYDITGDSESVEIVESQTIQMSPVKDPLATVTVAELYVEQGFLDKAVDVYRELLESDPDNNEMKKRLAVLSCRREEIQAADENAGMVEVLDAPVISAGAEGAYSTDEDEFCFRDVPEGSAVAVLESWLANIKRGRNVH
jgi:predicted Zn-dependent protease